MPPESKSKKKGADQNCPALFHVLIGFRRLNHSIRNAETHTQARPLKSKPFRQKQHQQPALSTLCAKHTSPLQTYGKGLGKGKSWWRNLSKSVRE
jgi:hypothetical protein